MNDKIRKSLILGGAGIASMGLSAQQRPNIIFIMSDDHTTQAISSYDSSLIKTPNIDKLANEGVLFTNCFCTNAISAPSRASILTGSFSHENGLYNNVVVFDTAQINLSKVLRSDGYQTAIVGKWHLKIAPSGFDYWNILPGQGSYYNPDFIKNGEEYRAHGYVTDLITDDALEWISQRDTTRPFFIMIHNKAPHRNWMPRLNDIENYWNTDIPVPDNFYDDYKGRTAAQMQHMSVDEDMLPDLDLKIIHPDSTESLEARYMGLERMDSADRAQWSQLYRLRYEEFVLADETGKELARLKYNWYMQDYLATIDAVDENVGRVLSYLRDHNLDQNTIVVYTSDQGFFLGEHGWFDKRFMYEESLRMPLLIRYPEQIEAGVVRDQLVMNVDFAPSFLDYAGAEAPESMQGESFRGLIEDSTNKGREAVYYHYFEHPGEHSVQRHYGIRTDQYKLIHFYYKIDDWELYDLVQDPSEMNNLYGNPDYSDVQLQMTARLDSVRRHYGDTIQSVPPSTKATENIARVSKSVFKTPPNDKYTGGGDNALYDGVIENPTPLNPGSFDAWCGFEGEDMNVEWKLESQTFVKTVTVRFLEQTGSWIFLPEDVEVWVAGNDKNYTELPKARQINVINRPNGGTVHECNFLVQQGIRYIRVMAKNRGVCPEGHPGEGQPAWLFIDEIILQ